VRRLDPTRLLGLAIDAQPLDLAEQMVRGVAQQMDEAFAGVSPARDQVLGTGT
jgi:hypothetical protein